MERVFLVHLAAAAVLIGRILPKFPGGKVNYHGFRFGKSDRIKAGGSAER